LELLLSDGFDNKIIRMNIKIENGEEYEILKKFLVIGLRILVE
jgi:hypothetical protein